MKYKDKNTGVEYPDLKTAIDCCCRPRPSCQGCLLRNGRFMYCGREYTESELGQHTVADLLGLEPVVDDAQTTSQSAAQTALLTQESQGAVQESQGVVDDPVQHPSHYTQGGIECIDALTAMISGYDDPNDAALTWQVGKYIWRHPFKGKPLEDLKKARFYLDRLIAYLEGKTP